MWEDATIFGVVLVLLCARTVSRVAMAAQAELRVAGRSNTRAAMLQAAPLVFMLAVLCVSLPSPTEAVCRPRKTNMRFYLAQPFGGPECNGSRDNGSVRQPNQLQVRASLRRANQTSAAEVQRMGRAQGFYMWDNVKKQQNNACVLLFFTCTFNSVTRYEGSSIVVQGSIGWDMPFYEVAIVSGTGRFRLTQGYAVVDRVLCRPQAQCYNPPLTQALQQLINACTYITTHKGPNLLLAWLFHVRRRLLPLLHLQSRPLLLLQLLHHYSAILVNAGPPRHHRSQHITHPEFLGFVSSQPLNIPAQEGCNGPLPMLVLRPLLPTNTLQAVFGAMQMLCPADSLAFSQLAHNRTFLAIMILSNFAILLAVEALLCH
ncbi:hypothetical protein L7F22_031664 [Adiantum nelumboides]|nr:hypothetical protein [Adiantum nelumboides]